MNSRLSLISTLALVGLLPLGCTWLPPEKAAPSLTQQAPLTSTAAQDGQWPEIQWWKKYGDADLDALIERALQNAPSLATAEARFSSARESVRVAAAASGLQVEAQGSASRQRLSDNGLIAPRFVGFNWYNQADLGLRATYTFDFWHKLDAATRAAVSEARAAQAEHRSASLSLAASIADTYFGWQADTAQLALAREQLKLSDQRRAITASRVKAGIESVDNLSAVDVELANTRENLLALEYSAQLRRVALAALLGVDESQLPAFTTRALPTVNARLPENVRIDLLARRADIAASYWRVDAASQQLKVARAEFLPDISINALAGLSSINLGKLLEAGSAAPSITGAIHLPLFDSGRLHAQYGARAAMLQAAASTYNDTVIKAAREVAVQVTTLQKLIAQRAERDRQSDATEQLLRTATARNRQGLSDARPMLSAAQSVQQQRSATLNLDAAAISADINLTLALGGGYATPDAAKQTRAATRAAPAVTTPSISPAIPPATPSSAVIDAPAPLRASF